MTQPSALLDAIITELSAVLAPVIVRQTDDLSDDVSEQQTFRAPAVVVTCTGLTDMDRDTGALSVSAQLVARCYARLAGGGGSRGDVAMNLAAVVAQQVEGRIWGQAAGAPIATMRAQRIAVRNRTSREMMDRGVALWTVSWTQLIELGEPDAGAILHAFRTLHVTMGGTAQEPHAAATLELEGGTPP